MKEEQIRQASGTAAKTAEKSRHHKIAMLLNEKDAGKLSKSKKNQVGNPVAAALIEGAQLASYHFDYYKGQDKDDPPSRIEEITILAPSKPKVKDYQKGVEHAEKLCEAVIATRDLMHHPGNTATPAFLAKATQTMARKHKITCKILEKKDMEKLGMGSLLGVSRGQSRTAQVYRHGIQGR